MDQVFVSYTHKNKALVEPVVKFLKSHGLSVYWDNQLRPGEWEPQLEQKIAASEVFIIFVTRDILDPREDGSGTSYVFNEINMAIDAGIKYIFPIIVGRISLNNDFEQLSRFHGLKVDAIEDVVASQEFWGHVKSFKAYIESGGRASENLPTHSADADMVGWPVAGDNLVERQALALAVMLLEGEQPFLINDAAKWLQKLIEDKLRPMTEEETNAQPRVFGGTGQSALLDSIGAQRLVPEAGNNSGVQLLEFKRPGHAAQLLQYLWSEQPEVRSLLVDWLQRIFESDDHRSLALHLGRGLTHLARIDLAGLEYEMLWRFVRAPFSHNELVVFSQLLAAAYDEPKNRQRVSQILDRVYQGEWLEPGEGRALAIIIALDALAERSPEPAVKLLRKADSYVRASGKAGHSLRKAILHSPVLCGSKESTVSSAETHIAMAEEDVAEKSKDTSPDLPETEVEVSEAADDAAKDEAATDDTVEGESAEDTARNSNSTYSAQFLVALAKWIDEPISDRKKLIRRQFPLWMFMSAFQRMPLYRKSAPDLLTLEELVVDLGGRDSAILDHMVNGFCRAALAKAQPGSEYRAVQHMNLVCRLFAHERKKSAHRKTGEDDPYLVFLRRCHQQIIASDTGREAHLLRGCQKYMSAQDISFIVD
ncbi:toll/interleukin-1 receptor domain-containing protein [Ruegeria halocynthiae]|uniref:toll/interleukin-1 receptor domain-containing protein n=1 Tax=Ruegeria halocynthiae TaxID=985054 RepID=UPI00055A602E|nr:toll/interleukin-1 receptor domain-containing protein [Ruegeria halocynthiae]